jgi:hypothetical protein
MGRVSIGTCSGPAEAALVRAAFEAHDIRVLINAEQHASMLGGLGGSFVPLHIFVADEDAEEAAALLQDLREHDREDQTEDQTEDQPGDESSTEPSGADDEADDADASSVDVRVDRRRRSGVVMLLALCVTFGTAHMYTGAWFRGIGLAGLEVLAFRYMMKGSRIGGILLASCIVADLVGAMWRVRAAKARIPQARVHR